MRRLVMGVRKLCSRKPGQQAVRGEKPEPVGAPGGVYASLANARQTGLSERLRGRPVIVKRDRRWRQRTDSSKRLSFPCSFVPGLDPGTYENRRSNYGPWVPTKQINGLKTHGSSPTQPRPEFDYAPDRRQGLRSSFALVLAGMISEIVWGLPASDLADIGGAMGAVAANSDVIRLALTNLEPIIYIFERFRIRRCFVNQPRCRATQASAQLQGWRQRVIIRLRGPGPIGRDLPSGAFECPAHNGCPGGEPRKKSQRHARRVPPSQMQISRV